MNKKIIILMLVLLVIGLAYFVFLRIKPEKFVPGSRVYCNTLSMGFKLSTDISDSEREAVAKKINGKIEWYDEDLKLMRVKFPGECTLKAITDAASIIEKLPKVEFAGPSVIMGESPDSVSIY